MTSNTLPRVFVMDVTPEQAKEWLNSNVHNRNVRPAVVHAFARDMAAGRWHLNGESIKLANSGLVLDGQHRLHAQVEADATVTYVIVTGLADDVQQTIDIGTRRSTADQLHLRGEKQASALAATLRRAVMWDEGYKTNTGAYRPTQLEINEYLRRWPGIRASVEIADRGRRYVAAPGSVLGLCHHVLNRIDPEACREFFEMLIEGVGLQYGHPVHALRKRLAEDSSGERINETYALGYVLKAWNLTREGASIAKLQAPKGGWSVENIPDPK